MRTTFQTITQKGIDRDSFPMKLWEKAKKYGTWNPKDISFAQDRVDWLKLQPLEKEFVLRNVASFQAGEEAVTLDLLPLIMAIAKEGRLEEEMFLTSFLWEEAKHVDGFNLFLTQVIAEEQGDLESLMVPSYREIFYKILPETLNKLTEDPSPVNMARASVTYNMIIEGVLAETGYFSFHKMLGANNIMPGMMDFVGKLKQDESRHIAYGIFLLSRLIAEHGEPVWKAIEDQMNYLLPLCLNVINEAYSLYDTIPFGLDIEEFNQYAIGQFQKRYAKLDGARKQSVAQVMADTFE
jgi:ribonucleoside-diphosphate reductase beta chain